MMKKGRTLVSEAVNDAKALKEAALAAAKNELVESMAPALRSLLEKSLKGALSEDVDRIRRGVQDNWPGESHTGFEEGKKKGEPKMDKEFDAEVPQDEKLPGEEPELDLEALAGFFPQMSELSSEEGMDGLPPEELPKEGALGSGIPTLGEMDDPSSDDFVPEVKEAKEKDKKDKEDEKMDEEIEISEAELKKVYEAALQTEAQVTKGFGEMTKMGELDDVAKDVDKGLADVKKGEHAWEKEEPPAKQDYTVKEMRQFVARGLEENKQLRENLQKAVGIIRSLGSKLHEVNLFNSKVLHVNRILNTHGRLTTEQRKVVLESIDKAKTIDEVKMVFEAITGSFAVATRLSESKTRKPVANAQRPRTSGGADQKVLSESVDRNNEGFSRLQKLAGLVK